MKLRLTNEDKLAFGVVVIFVVIILYSIAYLSSVIAYSRVKWEVRSLGGASYVLKSATENKFSASNNPAGCLPRPAKVSYLNNLELARILSNPKIMSLPTSVHRPDENKEYAIEITQDGRTVDYYYSPSMLPPELKQLRQAMESSWTQNLQKFGFE